MAMRIVKAFPPNYPELREKFKIGGKTDVIFSYGDTIYSPGGVKLHKALIAHEEAHGERQREMGVEDWWRQYVDDMHFRFREEVIGHRAEWQAFLNEVPLPGTTRKRMIFDQICKRLSGPLYGYMCAYPVAEALIKTDPCPDFHFQPKEQPKPLVFEPIIPFTPASISLNQGIATFNLLGLTGPQVGELA